MTSIRGGGGGELGAGLVLPYISYMLPPQGDMVFEAFLSENGNRFQPFWSKEYELYRPGLKGCGF